MTSKKLTSVSTNSDSDTESQDNKHLVAETPFSSNAADLLSDLADEASRPYSFPENVNFKIEFPLPLGLIKTVCSPSGLSTNRDMNELALLPYQSRNWMGKMKVSRTQIENHLQESCERKLRMYANSNNVEMVEKYLIEQTNPNATDLKKRTALHVSAARGHYEVVRLLLQHGADPNQKDSNGNTPLHLAACTSNFYVITILLQGGTNIEECDNAGYSPLHLAKSRLQMLKRDTNSSSDTLKKEVSQIVQMMQIYLTRAGASIENDLLSSFRNKLSISTCRQDIEDNLDVLLNSLKKLNLT